MEKTHCCLSGEFHIYLDELHLVVWERISPLVMFSIVLFSSILVILLFMQFHFFYCLIQNLREFFVYPAYIIICFH